MARAHFVKKARKDNPAALKGESYYWWKFRFGGKHYSTTKPRPSQLTQSAYYSTVRAISENIEDSGADDWDALVSLRDDAVGEIGMLRDETQDSLDNMPESLQYSPTGELLQERVDALDGAESELESIVEDEDDGSLEIDECVSAMSEAISNCEI